MVSSTATTIIIIAFEPLFKPISLRILIPKGGLSLEIIVRVWAVVWNLGSNPKGPPKKLGVSDPEVKSLSKMIPGLEPRVLEETSALQGARTLQNHVMRGGNLKRLSEARVISTPFLHRKKGEARRDAVVDQTASI